MLARLQLEHGDFLSHRTFRVRHIMQLRSFGTELEADADALVAANLAFSSDGEAEATAKAGGAADIVTGGSWDIIA